MNLTKSTVTKRLLLGVALTTCLFKAGIVFAQVSGDAKPKSQSGQSESPKVNATAEASSSETGLGKPDEPLNRISGKVLLISGVPASSAKIRIVGNMLSGIDATIFADEAGRFDFAVRYASQAIPNLKFWVESNDGNERAFHRFAWEEKDRIIEDIELKLQAQKDVEVEVFDVDGKPIENAKVALQLQYPNIIDGFVSNSFGRTRIELPEKERIEAVVAWKDDAGLDYRLYSLSRTQKADVKAVPPEFPKGSPERLILNGTSPLKVKVVEDSGEPIAKVSVYPWLLHKDSASDSLNLSYFSEAFAQVTNPSGEATFEWMPSWQKQLVTVWPSAEGYERPRGNYDPAKGDGTLSITLARLVPIRGQVMDPTGAHIQGVVVTAHGNGRSHNQFDHSVRTDAVGKYEILVAPNHVYIVTARLGDTLVAAPQTGFAVFPNQPLYGRDFQLRKPTRVHGRLLNERTKEPIPNAPVIVYQFGTGLHELEGVELPNPENERWSVQPLVFHIANSNALGEFEFLLGDGKFDLRPPQQEKAEKFEIDGQKEMLLNVATIVQTEVELVGKVLSKSDNKPIANVKLEGVPRSFRGSDWQAETDSQGIFKVRRRDEPTYVHAKSADRSLAAIQEIDPSERSVVIHLLPVVIASGRLLSRDKQPLINQQIDYGIKVPDVDNQTWSTRFGGKVFTNSEGEFELKSLAAGREYELSFPHTPEGVIQTLTKITIPPGESKNLGDVIAPAPYKPYVPPTLEMRIQEAFDVNGTPIERHQRALERIKLVKQHLLIVFGEPNDLRIRRLMDIRFNDSDFQKLSDEFRFMAIPTDAIRLPGALALFEQLGEELSKEELAFHLVILDAAGKKVASGGITRLCRDDQLSKDKLMELFRDHLSEPLDARRLLDEALKQAAKENKRILVQETATWCGPCHLLSQLLDSNRVWDKDYIWVKMDHRWTGAVEVMAEMRAKAQGGIPWFAILNAQGEKLATSNDSKTSKNIGFPSESEGKEHFAKMLNATRQRMTEEDVNSLIESMKTLNDKVHDLRVR